MMKPSGKGAEVLCPDDIRSADPRRWLIRRLTALACVVTACLYFLVAFDVLTVESTAESVLDLFAAAGFAYLLGAAALLACDSRWMWLLGAGVQSITLFAYFWLAGDRDPAYEAWGIVIKAVQAMILLTLVYLAATRPGTQPADTIEPAEEKLFGEIVEAETPYR